MRIVLRPSGGRGEYELSGSQQAISASDLYGHEIYYELTPDLIIPARAKALLVQGKPRFRLDYPEGTTHFYRLLSAVLLLPKPIREIRKTHGAILLSNAYSMTSIRVDVVDCRARRVNLRPVDLRIENSQQLIGKIVVADRMERVIRLWDQSTRVDSRLARLVRQHKSAVTASLADHIAVEKTARAIASYLKTKEDILPLAERHLELVDSCCIPSLVEIGSQPHDFGEIDDVSPDAARIARLKEWRRAAVRGSNGRRFRQDVSESYNYKCLFTGQRLPQLDVTESPGVDAAHILPWSTHDIDSPRNGICLSKLCHWAFDEGILRLRFVTESRRYMVEVPANVRQAALPASFDLAYFDRLTGLVPESNLPRDRTKWPSHSYLNELNRLLDGQL
jgi:hypothetical protein